MLVHHRVTPQQYMYVTGTYFIHLGGERQCSSSSAAAPPLLSPATPFSPIPYLLLLNPWMHEISYFSLEIKRI